MIFFTEWFQIQRDFSTPFEEMSPPELNICLQKLYQSVSEKTRRRRSGKFCWGLIIICPIETFISLMQRDDPLHFILHRLTDIRPFNVNYSDATGGADIGFNEREFE